MVGKYLVVVLIAAAVGAQEESSTNGTVYKKPEIYSLNIISDIKYRFATTRVTSRVKNDGTEPREAIFDVTLPEEAFISNLTIEENGNVIVGEIKKKEEARRQYVAAQQRGESAGYIGTKHRETNRFNLAITVAPLSKLSFNLTYQELLQRKRGHYEQVVYIDPGQTVPEMEVTVSILESRNITKLRVPPLRNDIGKDLIVLDSLTIIDQPTPKSAYIKFFPSVEQQLAQSASGMAGQFVIQYDVERSMDAGDVVVVNGYFVHFFAPEGLEPIPNDVLFILDNSGSMSGKKLKQLKEAMHAILADMHEGDRINLMTFSGSTFMWQQKMMDITDEDNLEDAKSFVDSIAAVGSTNINLALTTGIEFMTQLWDRDEDVRSPVIVFLTDGQATSGVVNDEQILKNVRNANVDSKISIFSLAFGASADYELVKKVAIQNNGFGKRIYEASDASMQILGFYNEISLTLLKNLSFHYLDAPVSNLTQHYYENYFSGSEVIICGMIEDYDRTDLLLRVESKSVNGPRNLVIANALKPEFDDQENLTRLGDYEKITEKVWAYLTIKQLLEKELASSNDTEKKELKKRVLDLSLMYDFVTPLTSMVVTKNDKTEGPNVVTEEDSTPNQAYVARRYHSPSGGRAPSLMQSADISSFFRTGAGRVGAQSRQAPGAVPNSLPVLPMLPDASGSYSGLDMVNGPVPKPVKEMHPPAHKKISKGKPKKKKGKGKRKAFPMPLKVTVKDVAVPVCFSLYTDQLVNGNRYLLYREKGSAQDVEILVEMEKRMLRKKKVFGGIRTISFITGNETNTIVSDGEDGLMMNANQKLDTDYTKELNGFKLSVANAKEGFLNVLVHSLNYDEVSNEGILGSILTKKMKQKQRKGKKPRKKYSLLKVNKTVVKMAQLSTIPFSDNSNECLFSKKESVFYDLQQFRQTVKK